MTIFYTNLDYESGERFDLAKFLEFNEDNFDILNSFFLTEVLNLPYVGNFVVQDESESPDYVSKKIYGRHQYWWLLMYYNNIFDFKRLTKGTVLKYFSLSDLESLFFKLKSLEVLKSTTQATGVRVATTSTSSGDKNYIFTQVILSSTWVINHPLKKQPSVTVIVKDSNGDEIVIYPSIVSAITFTIVYPSGYEDSRVVINFSIPCRGKVILN